MALEVSSVTHDAGGSRDRSIRSQDWLKWLRDLGDPKHSLEDRLAQYAKELIDAWKDVGVEDTKDNAGTDNPPHVPKVQDIFEAVDLAKNTWTEKNSKGFSMVRSRFCSFARTMENYSFLFSVIPSGDKYTSLITGVVSSVIKVSANYEKAAEAFSTGLEGLRHSLSFVDRELSIVRTPRLQELVVELYVEVFKFLCYAMKWFMKKGSRFKKSFDSKYYENIKESVSEINSVVKRIRQEGEQIARSNVKTLDQSVGELRMQLNQYIDENRNSMSTVHNGLKRLELLDSISGKTVPDSIELEKMLECAVNQYLARIIEPSKIQSSLNINLSLQPRADQKYSMSSTYAASKNNPNSDGKLERDTSSARSHYSKNDIQAATTSLYPYIQSAECQTNRSYTTSAEPALPMEALTSLNKWVRSKDSQILWIEGPLVMTNVSLKMAAADLSIALLNSGVPCISTFNDKYASIVGEGKQIMLVRWLYSILLQVIGLLPLEFESELDFRSVRFAELDGTWSSSSLTLGIIRDLLTVIPSEIHWIFTDVSLIEDRDTRSHIADLVKLLRERAKMTTNKVCFTTMGNSYILSQCTTFKERVHIS